MLRPHLPPDDGITDAHLSPSQQLGHQADGLQSTLGKQQLPLLGTDPALQLPLLFLLLLFAAPPAPPPFPFPLALLPAQ